MKLRFTLVSSRNDQDRHVVVGESHDHHEALAIAVDNNPPPDGRPLVFLEGSDGWFVRTIEDISDDGGAEVRAAASEAERLAALMGLN